MSIYIQLKQTKYTNNISISIIIFLPITAYVRPVDSPVFEIDIADSNRTRTGYGVKNQHNKMHSSTL